LPRKASLASLHPSPHTATPFREVKSRPEWHNPAIAERTAAKLAIDFEAHIRKLAVFFLFFLINCFRECGALSARCRPLVTFGVGDGDTAGAARAVPSCNIVRSPAAKRSPGPRRRRQAAFDQP